MPIDPKFRTPPPAGLLPSQLDIPALKAAIASYVNSLEVGFTTLGNIQRRYQRPAKALNSSVSDLLGELCADGLIAQHRFPRLDCVYIFSESMWALVVADWNKGSNAVLTNIEDVILRERRQKRNAD